MKTVDVSGMIVLYNLAIGLLTMLASEKIGAYVACVSPVKYETTARLA